MSYPQQPLANTWPLCPISVTLFVPDQSRAGTEAPAAELAGERTLPGVSPQVDDQAAFLREASGAHFALVRLLPGVCPLVPVKHGAALEALVALRAGEGTLPSVGPLVTHEEVITVESAAALTAHVPLVPRVASQVSPQLIRAWKTCMADATFIRVLDSESGSTRASGPFTFNEAAVRAPVPLKRGSVTEAFPAAGAGKTSPHHVSFLVRCQKRWGFEEFSTIRTYKAIVLVTLRLQSFLKRVLVLILCSGFCLTVFWVIGDISSTNIQVTHRFPHELQTLCICHPQLLLSACGTVLHRLFGLRFEFDRTYSRLILFCLFVCETFSCGKQYKALTDHPTRSSVKKDTVILSTLLGDECPLLSCLTQE
ncbi:hypothetical protein FKM82_024162 [Ascaphus truei]